MSLRERCKDGHSLKAFNLVELLVVIAIIAILAGLLFPSLARGKATARIAQCLNNKRQVTLAWHLYSDDNDGWLAINPGQNYRGLPFTCDRQTWSPANATTNIAFLMDPAYSCLARYSQNREIYLCPEDHYVSAAQRAAGVTRRIRSISLNMTMGYWDGGISSAGWKAYFKTDDINRSTPSMRFVFIDEHPDTIFDAGFPVTAFGTESPWGFGRYPGALHNGGATLSFADAHVEFKMWRLADTKRPVTFSNWQQPMNQKEDYLWLWQRTGDLFKVP